MKRYQKFIIFWILNTFVLYLSYLVLPRSITFGNNIFVSYQAVIFSGFLWSVVLWYTDVVLKDLEVPTKNTNVMMFSYLIVNFATLWLIARFAFATGIGIANFWIVLMIAVAANLSQYLAWQYMGNKK